MNKLRFDNGADAVYRSSQEAEKRNCDLTSTILWWSVKRDETGYYLEIPDDETDALTTSEKSKLED